ncbi:adenosylcobinamide-GDP ribazoletransferase [Amycolatopsis palatopharyngis]|uniref:adenosylcobinamide-GDP ribazoletransferase n=1 Tax=Amycolatopsis palatopharyngis TaxID=187982 RepID=UPI000E23EAA4|nr:adenosylcobinamide-GDP ribazoletransferase [Amycolatopsis palatopharyngis]
MALGTLTALPVPAPRTIDRRVAAGAMLLAPLAAVVLAVPAGLVVWAGDTLGLPPLASAVLAVAVVALGSRGLHLDGLADTADGLGASYDRERALTVMRKGDAGPSGVATLTLVLLLQCAALAGAIEAGHGVVAVAVAVVGGRAVLALCCARGVPSARPEGLGATVAGAVPITAVVLVLALVGGLAAFAPGVAWWRGPLAVLLGCLATAALLARCVARLGGITGDVLGGCVEAATAAALLTLAP